MIYIPLTLFAILSILFFWWVEKRAAGGDGPQKVLVGFWLRLLADYLDISCSVFLINHCHRTLREDLRRDLPAPQ
jgi:hypothetical protein